MFFKKAKKVEKDVPFPGEKKAVDGHSAVIAVETSASQAVGIHAIPNTAQIVDRLRGGTLMFREMTSDEAVAGLLTGWTLSGIRATAFTSGNGLAEMHESLYAAVGKRLSYVINLTSRAFTKQATTLHGGHDDYHAVSDTGVFQLFAKNVQEAVDFALIAHRIAELALNPGVVAQDSYYTSHSVQNIQFPEPELIKKYLGMPDDIINCPTPAQEIIFGEKRRRIPELFNLDRPVGIGTVQDQDSFFRAVAAQRPFFFDHIAEITDRAFQEFAALTSRKYERVVGYELTDAEYVVVAQGSLVEDLEGVVDYLRYTENMKVGVLNLSMFRPFPGELIAECLKGKKGVTVLERTDQPLAEDLPILKEIRCAIDKAIEQGQVHGGKILSTKLQAYPHYPTYEKLEDRPPLFSGIYGIGGKNPSFADLLAVFKNMMPNGDLKKQFYVGLRFQHSNVRFPMLETLQQAINRNYPQLERLSLLPQEISTPNGTKKLPENHIYQIHSIAGSGGTMSSTMLAKALAEALNWNVKTYPEYGPNQSMQPTTYTILQSEGDVVPHNFSDKVDMVVVSNPKLLNTVSLLTPLKNEGILLIHSEYDPRDLWQNLSKAFKQQVKSANLKLYLVSVGAGERLAVQALIGAFVKVCPCITDDGLEKVRGRYYDQLKAEFGDAKGVIERNYEAMIAGGDAVREINWQSLPDDLTRGHVPLSAEPEPPWTVQAVKNIDGSLFDLARFWDSVGFFYETGQFDQILPDPFLATGVIPGRSSAFRDMTPYRTHIAKINPAKFAACDVCLAHFSDTAMPATLQDLPTLIDAGVKVCQANGHAMIQLQRIGDHLAKQAHKFFAKDQYLTLGALLTDSFAKLIEMMGLKGDQLTAIQADFDALLTVVSDFPIIKTEKYFDSFESAAKGSGLILSVVINPYSFKEGSSGQSLCPPGAIEMVMQTDELIQTYQQNWQFFLQLPPSPHVQKLITDDPQTLIHHLFDRKVYHSLVGGDGSFPGSGSRMAVHLATASIEAMMQPHIQKLIAKLNDLIARLEDKIQNKITSSLKINDFELLSQRLSKVKVHDLDSKALAEIIKGDQLEHGLDKDRLHRLTQLRNQLNHLRQLYQEGANGDGRARLAMALATGSILFWSGVFPYNPYPFPWVNHLDHDSVAVGEGLLEGIRRKMTETFKLIRLSELELTDGYRPDKHDTFFQNFDWQDFTDDEIALCPPLIVVGGDGALGEKGWAGVSSVLSSQLPIKIIVIDTQNYAATGGQFNSSSFGRGEFQRTEIGLLALMHPNCYVLQSSVGTPAHLMAGIMEGVKWSGPALFHIYAPDPQTHGLTPDQVIEQSRLAVESRAFPLFKRHPGSPVIDIDDNPLPDKDWANFDLQIADFAEIPFTFGDWAAQEARFRSHFEVLPRGEWHDDMKLLSEYIALKPQEREVLTPYINLIREKDGQPEVLRAVVSPTLVKDTENRLQVWHLLQELAGVHSPLNAVMIEQAEAEMTTKFEQEKSDLIAEYEAKLNELDQKHGEIYHNRLTHKLLTLAGYGQDAETFGASLREYLKNLNS